VPLFFYQIKRTRALRRAFIIAGHNFTSSCFLCVDSLSQEVKQWADRGISTMERSYESNNPSIAVAFSNRVRHVGWDLAIN
jgi:hypothetical protein